MLEFKARIVRIGLCFGVALVAAGMASSTYLHILDPGSMTPGHDALACDSCHVPAKGTTRQQIQANFAYILGFRKTAIAFGFRAPGSADCAACHERLQDPHALSRFAEPRFAETLKRVRADTCMGCHTEHQGLRVSAGADSCVACHADLAVKDDPLDVSHQALIVQGRWSTCLGCHDYHDNHKREVQQRLADAYDVEVIRSYLASGPDPYAVAKRRPALAARP